MKPVFAWSVYGPLTHTNSSKDCLSWVMGSLYPNTKTLSVFINCSYQLTYVFMCNHVFFWSWEVWSGMMLFWKCSYGALSWYVHHLLVLKYVDSQKGCVPMWSSLAIGHTCFFEIWSLFQTLAFFFIFSFYLYKYEK